MKAEEIAQWVLDNRHSKGEGRTTHDHEIYHFVKDCVIAFADEKTKSLKEEIGLKEIEINHLKTLLASCEKSLLDREDSLSLAKKENEELKTIIKSLKNES